MQSFVIPPEIVHEMDKADRRNYRKLTPSARYTGIKAVPKLVHKLNKRIDTGIVLGVFVAILNMNATPNTHVLDLPLHELQILLPLPRAQSTLPQELLLTGTRIPDTHLDMGLNGRTRTKCFVDRSITHSYICTLIAPRLFPQKILETKVLKTRFTPYIVVMIIKYREDE